MRKLVLAVTLLSAVPAFAADRLLIAPVTGKMPKPKLAVVETALLDALKATTSAEVVVWQDAKGTLPPKDVKFGNKCKKAPCWGKLAEKTQAKLVLGVFAAMVKKQPQVTLTLVDGTGSVMAESRYDLGEDPSGYAANMQQAVAGLNDALPHEVATQETMTQVPTVAAADATSSAPATPAPGASSTSATPLERPAGALSGWMGVRYSPVTSSVASRFNLPNAEGAWVVKLHPNGPAKTSGLELNDFVISWNGEAVANDQALGQFLKTATAGQEVTLEVWRNSQKVSLTVTLAERQAWP